MVAHKVGIFSEFIFNKDHIFTNAILFAKQGLAATHLVFKKYKKEPVLVGYFSLASKYITVSKNKVTSTTARRIAKFAAYNQYSKAIAMSSSLL